METQQRIQTRRERKMRKHNEEIVVFLMGAVVSVLVLCIVVLLITTNQNQHSVQQVNREVTGSPVTVCTSMAVSNSNPDIPLMPIVYEDTFLYQEELEEMKCQEELRREEELKRQEEERQEELRKQAEAEAEEFLYLQKLTFAEAQGESMKGKILVAASVVNRKNHPTKFPNTIKEVVEEVVDGVPQYTDISYICEEYINQYSWRQAAWEDCRVAAERALSGEDPAAQYLGGPTLYFYNPDKCSLEQIENRLKKPCP